MSDIVISPPTVTSVTVWNDGILNRVHHGDCIARMNDLPAGSVDLAFADPPFNIGYEYDVYDDVREKRDYLDWSKQWIGAVQRVLKPDGTFWLAIGDEYAAELKVISQDLGFHCRGWVIWYYTFGVNCKAKFSRSHAHLFQFVKDSTKYTFRSDAPENRIPSARQLVYGDNRANPKGRLPDDTWILRPQDLSGCFSPQEDMWYFPRVAGTFKERAGFHGCQMPEQLLGRIVRLCSHEGDVVLDPFSGSATTLAVAKKLGRRFLGFDLSPDYVQRGTDRLANCRMGDPLDGAAEPTVSAPSTVNGTIREGGKRIKKKSAAQAGDEPAAEPLSPAAAEMFESGLISAFTKSNEGYSLDRLIADPVLNRHFVEECEELGLPGDARIWNWRLFNLRKAGKLTDSPTASRTEMSWQDCDDFLFASEIAFAQMLANGSDGLDAILCDPDQVAEFDRIARSFAPGITPFRLRWGALKLRKESKAARARATVMKSIAPAKLGKARSVANLDWSDVPEQAGLYLVTGKNPSVCLYAGGTLNLRRRLGNQFRFEVLDVWKQISDTELDSLTVQFFTANPSPPDLLAYQSLLVTEHSPKLNLPEFSL